ncbi:PfkB family carbohydrate kinase [Halalkalibacter lacteus]|uniref:PfkB family carbohydrate kinase n=1 Tax=Halalkalibacter lacteus TaxID=3090663 RepID=UPI002FC96ABF
MYDVTALGELLIDFTPNGTSEKGESLFEQNPDGAPANVLVALAKLNKQTAFIGKVGNDQFGHYLKKVMVEHKVDTSDLVISQDVNTTLAFVHLDEDGERSFNFY